LTNCRRGHVEFCSFEQVFYIEAPDQCSTSEPCRAQPDRAWGRPESPRPTNQDTDERARCSRHRAVGSPRCDQTSTPGRTEAAASSCSRDAPQPPRRWSPPCQQSSIPLPRERRPWPLPADQRISPLLRPSLDPGCRSRSERDARGSEPGPTCSSRRAACGRSDPFSARAWTSRWRAGARGRGRLFSGDRRQPTSGGWSRRTVGQDGGQGAVWPGSPPAGPGCCVGGRTIGRSGRDRDRSRPNGGREKPADVLRPALSHGPARARRVRQVRR
jgi:hypothetical protein